MLCIDLIVLIGIYVENYGMDSNDCYNKTNPCGTLYQGILQRETLFGGIWDDIEIHINGVNFDLINNDTKKCVYVDAIMRSTTFTFNVNSMNEWYNNTLCNNYTINFRFGNTFPVPSYTFNNLIINDIELSEAIFGGDGPGFLLSLPVGITLNNCIFNNIRWIYPDNWEYGISKELRYGPTIIPQCKYMQLINNTFSNIHANFTYPDESLTPVTIEQRRLFSVPESINNSIHGNIFDNIRGRIAIFYFLRAFGDDNHYLSDNIFNNIDISNVGAIFLVYSPPLPTKVSKLYINDIRIDNLISGTVYTNVIADDASFGLNELYVTNCYISTYEEYRIESTTDVYDFTSLIYVSTTTKVFINNITLEYLYDIPSMYDGITSFQYSVGGPLNYKYSTLQIKVVSRVRFIENFGNVYILNSHITHNLYQNISGIREYLMTNPRLLSYTEDDLVILFQYDTLTFEYLIDNNIQGFVELNNVIIDQGSVSRVIQNYGRFNMNGVIGRYQNWTDLSTDMWIYPAFTGTVGVNTVNMYNCDINGGNSLLYIDRVGTGITLNIDNSNISQFTHLFVAAEGVQPAKITINNGIFTKIGLYYNGAFYSANVLDREIESTFIQGSMNIFEMTNTIVSYYGPFGIMSMYIIYIYVYRNSLVLIYF